MLFLMFFMAVQNVSAGNLVSHVDTRMELMSIVAKMAGYPEYNRREGTAYNQSVNNWFDKFKTHPAIETAKEMRSESRPTEKQLQWDGVFMLAMHLVIENDSVFLNPNLITEGVDDRCFNELTPRFIEDLNDFYKVSDARGFFESNKELYARLETYMQQNILNNIDDRWLESFFGYAPENFNLVQTLLTGTYNYGATTVSREGVESACASISLPLDINNQPRINEKWAISIIIHEFTHYYWSPLIEKNKDLLLPYVATIFSQMGDIEPYAPDEAVLSEPLTVAVEALYDKRNNNDFRATLAQNKDEGTYFIEDLMKKIEEYDSNRSKYKNIDDFMPEIVEFYKGLADHIVSDHTTAE